MASMAACGAFRPRCFFAAVSRAAAKTAAFSAGLPSLSLRSRVLGAGLAATSLAKAMAPARRSPSIILSTMPDLKASSAFTGLPVVHISTALATPARRGRRCVPAAPGMMPSFTSGWPTCALATATRVARHGNFEAAAESRAVNGDDHRLFAVFDFQKKREQARAARFSGSHFAEFFNVRASYESSPTADEDDGFDGIV